MNSLLVKICGNNNRENLSSIINTKADFLGFIFYEKSERNISLNQFHEIKKIVPERFRKVAVLVNPSIDNILSLNEANDFFAIQIHALDDFSLLSEIKNKTSLKIILSLGLHEDFDFEYLNLFQDKVEYFLFDTKGPKEGGNGIRFNWELLKLYDLNIPFFLAGGINSSHLEEIKELSKNLPMLIGVDLNSGFEIAAGIKDFNLVNSFINEIKKNRSEA